MKIFLVANTSWYLYNFRLPLFAALLSKGCWITALAPKDKYALRFSEYGVDYLDISISRSGVNPLQDISLMLKFASIYKRHNPAIVQHFTSKPVIYGTLGARLAGVKHIYNMIPGLGYVFTGMNFKKRVLQKLIRILYRFTLRFSEHIYFQNKEDWDYFMKHHIVDAMKTSVVPGTGVDLAKFYPVRKAKNERIIFIMTARMLWDKGVKEYVDAARVISDKELKAEFWLLGPVDEQNPKAISQEQLQEWHDQGIIKYFGMTDDTRSYLEKADVIVLPSYYREGIPLSLLEGAAMGMPIITTDSTGCREVVDDGKNGFLIPIKDMRALAAAMERFVREPELITSMGAESRKKAVAKFDSQKIIQEILKYYPI